MGLGIRVTITGGRPLIDQLRARGGFATVNTRLAIGSAAVQLQGQARANHRAGRPGPIVRTYNLHDSILVAENLTEFNSVVGSGAPYALRMEFGFVGIDSLGRVYAQPPYPFFGPAVEKVRPIFEDLVRKAVS
jgi:hypothetical protein